MKTIARYYATKINRTSTDYNNLQSIAYQMQDHDARAVLYDTQAVEFAHNCWGFRDGSVLKITTQRRPWTSEELLAPKPIPATHRIHARTWTI